MRKFLFLGLILLHSSTLFAICEHERGQRNHFQTLCDAATGASVVGAVAGNLVFPVIGGVIFGGLFASPAIAACQERDRWQQQLEQCERNAIRRQEERDRAEAKRQRKVTGTNTRYDQMAEQARQEFHSHMQQFAQDLQNEGYDADVIINEVEQERLNQAQALEERLRQIEEQRQMELRRI